MTAPIDEQTAPTQVQHPWRSTARTVAVAAIALIPLLPSIAQAANIDQVPAVAAVLGVAAAVSRVFAIPAVEDWLQRYLPSLAADPAAKGVYEERKDSHDDR